VNIAECCVGDTVRIVDDGGFTKEFVRRFEGRTALVLGFLTYSPGSVRLMVGKRDGRGKPFDAVVNVKFLEHA